MSNCMGGRKTKKMSGGGSAGAAAQQKVEKDLKTREKIRKDIREELDAVPFKDKVKKVINKVTGNAKGGKIKGYAGGGFPDLNKDGKVTRKDVLMGRGVKMAKGGSVKGRRGDGICSRGRTKGRMV